MAVKALEPAAYESLREGGAEIVALPFAMATVRQALALAGTLYDFAAAQPDVREFTGRGAAYGLSTRHGQWVVRHYRRGGAIAGVLEDRYLRLGPPRAMRELRASAAARSRGVPTPEVVAAVTYPAGAFYRADLATRYVEDSADLAESVLGAGRASPQQRVEIWRAAGALLRLTLAAGVEHRDLNLRNILIQQRDDGPPTAFLLDLDRARVHEQAVSNAVQSRMIHRLQRSRRKLESAAGARTTAAELAVFEEAVRGG
jgi:3-deoxy-D-manno-octulosonic acid kinase